MAISTAAALLGSAAISAGSSFLAGGAQADAAGQAAALSAEATRLSVAEQRRQFDLVRGDLAPYRDFGGNALAQYAALYGIGRGTLPPGGVPAANAALAGGTGTNALVGGAGTDALAGTGAPVAFSALNLTQGGRSAASDDITEEGDVISGDTTEVELEAFLPLVLRGLHSPEDAAGRIRMEFGTVADRAEFARWFRDRLSPMGSAPAPSQASSESSGFLSTEEMQAARDRFLETPGYTFRFDEGIRALDRSASATGRLRGGGYTRELTRYGQGIAAEEFGTYADRLAGLAGMGQGATTTSGTLGVRTGANIGNTLIAGAGQQGNALLAAGTARASGFAGVANAASGGAQNWMLFNLLQNQR